MLESRPVSGPDGDFVRKRTVGQHQPPTSGGERREEDTEENEIYVDFKQCISEAINIHHVKLLFDKNI